MVVRFKYGGVYTAVPTPDDPLPLLGPSNGKVAG